MQTRFTPDQLADPDIGESNRILRACVHCGFCTATCPTYVLLGDERDSPRGRIYMIKEMLESGGPASPEVVTHVDRCLSCLSCMTTCPASVDYMHLVDHARHHIARTYRRPPAERLLRALLAAVLPRPALFRAALHAAALARPLAQALPGRLGALASSAPRRAPARAGDVRPGIYPAEGARRARVALLAGCAQRVLRPSINAATIRLLTRHGVEVVVAKRAGCCGALAHHLGESGPARSAARANIDAWLGEEERAGLDGVVVNASGCGVMVKDYGFIFRNEPEIAPRAARISGMAKDVSEFLSELGLKSPVLNESRVVAYQSACALQHGQGITEAPVALLHAAGFVVRAPAEAHMCCGSAGTYSLLQPEIATRLRDRKIEKLQQIQPDIIATGNIGCLTQLAAAASVPVVHTVELLDWATGGPPPPEISAP